MGKIIQLDDVLSNKIAAGEVVERPASVVKELVENAIDAKSSVIEIEIEEAGLSKIRIIDNGSGIDEEDVPLAFERHATSKIKDENDLFRIKTLGFRGEALPSIASVSHLEMVTATDNHPGSKIVIDGGRVTTREKAPSRRGTDITISDLFYNTPARLKYMKTIHTELGNITDVVNRLALAHPEVSIRLRHNERMLLQTNGNGDVRQVLAAIYGVNIARNMIPIKASSLDFQLEGYISMPEITRASRNYISTMINGRFIKNYSLVKAIQEGYHTLLPIGRFPIVLLSIQMDPILVDVNVHPAKLEVRLSKEQELNQLVSETIKAAFKKKELIPSGFAPVKKQKIQAEQTIMQLDHLPERIVNRPETVKSERPPTYQTNELPVDEVKQIVESNKPEFNNEESILPEEPLLPEVIEEKIEDYDEHYEFPAEQDISPDSPRVPPLYPIGQMHGTYIFAQNDKGLYIIDQHAAQERIKYEYFREKVGRVEKELQDLLVPLTFEYSTDETIKIQENLHELEKVGVFLEPFGHNSFIIRSHPVWFPKGDEQEIIEDMIEQLLSMKKVDIKKLREEAAIMMSCKGSIKANHHLRNDEIQALLDSLRVSSDPFTCPHGRPIIIHYSVYEMEKMFKRVM
ncbi:DNA mismatch repair endonuclease MutL [Heyndrickxia oleronia]|uniref:DNA mismatch repair protein MutL n=1 Tax=Heyndrickxia oleronia TaxID=38875 RepID=A0A8E2I4Q7_9BACI|nr:DNA mismatch repair endonuclease MutL [Heyndrickxia oleronia]MEC1377590.1 DNA mismatch repair endonuclease MutL [Heyndrickxia oleronia]OOP66656.1 DNA mismatch repair protein MutL [Heyndrickxia oleronia]QQZ03142.1 DNA mismatch repair endonuclease MutL [Heyndrickxia oleronia]GIN37446.1 DNA mismatch repair protein MutL [Heyndrickxia oleronia]